MYSFRLTGDDTFNDIWIIPRRKCIQFEVMACSDVHVVLSATPGDSDHDTHEVIIGYSDNTRLGNYIDV